MNIVKFAHGTVLTLFSGFPNKRFRIVAFCGLLYLFDVQCKLGHQVQHFDQAHSRKGTDVLCNLAEKGALSHATLI